MNTDNPIGPAPEPAPVTVTPTKARFSATLWINTVYALGSVIAAPQVMDLLNAIGAESWRAKLAAVAGVITALNIALRVFKTSTPIAGSPGETKARASG